jgi:hypothetical protein
LFPGRNKRLDRQLNCRKLFAQQLVLLKQMQKKSFKITSALKEGYAQDARVFSFEEAEQVIAQWMKDRLASDQPVVSGLLQSGTLIFPAPDKANETVSVSATVIFSGELSSEEDANRVDIEVCATLEHLASELKIALLQESVYISYLDRHWCV